MSVDHLMSAVDTAYIGQLSPDLGGGKVGLRYGWGALGMEPGREGGREGAWDLRNNVLYLNMLRIILRVCAKRFANCVLNRAHDLPIDEEI